MSTFDFYGTGVFGIRGDCDCGGEGMKPIRLSGHAKVQLFFRGTTEEEVIVSAMQGKK